VRKWPDDVALWQCKVSQRRNCSNRAQPKNAIADVEIGHRSVAICHIANITRELDRKLGWNPATERFVGDAEADSLLARPRRKRYELPWI
jgi:hypothetical protein